MNIVYDLIKLPDDFPFMVTDMNLEPYYTMGDFFHYHDCFELSFAKSGSGVYEIENRKYDLYQGELMIINNIEPHRMYVGEEGLNQIVIVFNPSLIWSGSKNLLDYDYIKTFVDRQEGFCNKISRGTPYFDEINKLVFEIEEEYEELQPGWQLMIKAKLLSLLTLLYRHFKSDLTTNQKRKGLLRLQPVLQKIEQNLLSPLTANEMAQILHVTPQHFCVVFKETTGQTFVEYIVSKRIDLVKQMLIDTDKGITQVAYDCGFKNLSYFNKAFYKKVGSTPSAYKKNVM
jgi:AraC-like DNA-binding protein